MFKKLTADIKEVPAILSQKYLPSLDGLRAIAVVIVILAHLNERVFKNEIIDIVIPYGNIGVYIFFVLSGFLITTLLLKERATTGNINLKEFYRRRFFRIIPVAYLFLTVMIVLKYIFNLDLTLQEIGGCFLFFRSLDGTFRQFYTGHFWSLSYEEQFYIMYPVILKKSLKLFLAVICIVILSQILYQIPYVYQSVHFPGKKLYYQFFIRFFDGLAFGSLFAVLVFQKIIKLDKPIKNIGIINLLIFLSIFFFQALKTELPLQILSSPLIATFIVLNLNPANKTFFYTILNSKPFIYIGKLSYSIYIWQQIFTMRIPWTGKFPYSDSVLLNLVLMFIVAYCSYNFYEKFFLKFRYKKVDNN